MRQSVLCVACIVALALMCGFLAAPAQAQTTGIYFPTGIIADWGWSHAQDARFVIENTFDWLWPTHASSGSILLIWDNSAWSNAWKSEMNQRGITWTERTGTSVSIGDWNVGSYRMVIISEYMNAGSLTNMNNQVTTMENYVNSGGVFVDMIGTNNTRRWSQGTPGPFGVTSVYAIDTTGYVAAVGHDMVTGMGTPYYTGNNVSHAQLPNTPPGSTVLVSAGTGPGGASVGSWLEIPLAPEITTPTPGSLGTLTEGQTGWSETFEATNGTAPYDWSLSGAPGWVGFNPIVGATVNLEAATVGAAGAYTFDVTVTDSTGADDTQTFSFDVSPPPLISGPGSLDGITEGGNWPAPATFSVTGGTGTMSWSATGLPPGMAINPSTGVLDGPVDPGSATGSPYSVSIVVEDANGVQDSYGPLTLTVNSAPIVTSNVLPLAPLTVAYSTFLQGTGGTTPFTWAISGNSGPFTVDPGTGEITGTPLTVASYTFDATLTDASGVSATGQVTIDTGEPPSIAPPMLPELTVTGAVPADTLIEATGGFPAQYVWTHTGTLPSGLSLSQVTLRSGDVAYQLDGTAQFGTVGTHTIDVTVEDTFQSLTDTVSVTIQINSAPTIDATGGLTLAAATMTGGYSAPFAVVAGTGTTPFSWSFDNVTGPAADLDGFSFVAGDLASSSVFGPAGGYTFDVTVTDKNGVTDSGTFTMTINPAPSFADPPYAREGKVYTASLGVEAGTGTGPFVYTIVSDIAVITGLSVQLGVDGVPAVSGTPPKGNAGTYTIELNVVDANGVSVTQTLSLVITVAEDSGCCGLVDSAAPGILWLLFLALVPVSILSRRRLHA